MAARRRRWARLIRSCVDSRPITNFKHNYLPRFTLKLAAPRRESPGKFLVPTRLSIYCDIIVPPCLIVSLPCD